MSPIDNGVVVPGWVTLAEDSDSDEYLEWTAEIKTGTRYLTATCYVLDALELARERDLVAHHGDADVAHALLVQVDERAPVDLVVREGLRVVL